MTKSGGDSKIEKLAPKGPGPEEGRGARSLKIEQQNFKHRILGRNTKVKVQGIPKRNFEKLEKVIEQEKRSGKKRKPGGDVGL